MEAYTTQFRVFFEAQCIECRLQTHASDGIRRDEGGQLSRNVAYPAVGASGMFGQLNSLSIMEECSPVRSLRV